MASRDYTKPTIKRLYARSLNKCYNPNCNEPLVYNNNNNKLDEIAHICGLKKGSKRYDDKMEDSQRNDYPNLIILCPTCHTKVDNDEKEYTVELLKEWKTTREREATQERLKKNLQLLSTAINNIAKIDLGDEYSEYKNIDSTKSFTIEVKMDYNNLREHRHIINSYKVYQGKIESIYNELESLGEGFRKEKLLFIIKNIYLIEKGKITKGSDDIQIIRKNSDIIFDNVLNTVREKINIDETKEDDIEVALPIIMVDAFMRCKILEEPNKDDSQ